MRLTDGTRFAKAALVCDLVALPLFVGVGLVSHRSGSLAVIFLRNAVPVMLAWMIAARVLGTYRPPEFSSLFATWVVAIPAGIVVRSWIVGSLGDEGFWVFLGVAMAFTLLFLGVGRAIAMTIARPWHSA
ncbi:MAG: DUF3054 domain-containing protein [Actinomycetota bacterium]